MSVKVAVRVRPFNSREKNLGCTCIVDMSDPKTILKAFQGQQEKPFTFDYSFWSFDQFQQDPSNGYLKPTGSKYADQKIVYDKIGNKILDNAFQGYHCCLFAYGQTGSGKSYSMIGYGSNKGIVPIICDEIFQRITKNKNAQTQCEVYCSMIQIYNQEIQDLTIPISKRVKGGLKVRQNKLFGVYVQGVKKNFVKSYQEIQDVMEEGTKNRTVAATQMNATSSRAHTVITIQFKQITKQGEAKSEKVSLINLVDLAGSQRQDKTGASGQRLKQAVGINLSLTNLGQVISTLADNAQGAKKFVPYRNSALTRILQNALGGNSQTVMICAISPANDNYEETLSTLRYADRAKKIQNKPVVNETAQDKLIRQLKEENQRLKKVLEKQGKDPNIKITEENKKPDQNNEKWQQQLKKFDQQRKKLQEQKKKLQEQKLKLEQEKNQQDQQNKMLEQSNKRLEENLKNLEFNNKKMEESYRLQDEINKKMGFSRAQCKCGHFYWRKTQSKKTCGDSNCEGKYSFIGTGHGIGKQGKKLTYVGAWQSFKKSLTSTRIPCTAIDRYPVVARWRNDVDYVAAGIYCFQPYCVTGELQPPANPLICPQFSVRFNDLDNIGLTGRHYSGFVMLGIQVFNKPQNYIFFKEECVQFNYRWLTEELKIDPQQITFIQDIWAGGGNLGPSVQYFVGGLELGNMVFMQYKYFHDGRYEQLSVKVIDVGIGLERIPWLINGSPTSYYDVFTNSFEFLSKKLGIVMNNEVWEKLGPYSSRLDIDESEDIDKTWSQISNIIDVPLDIVKKQILPLKELYVILDHTRTALVIIEDGGLPSNVGGGSNCRNIVRRVFAVLHKNGWWDKIGGLQGLLELFDHHRTDLQKLFGKAPQYKSFNDIIKIQYERWASTQSSQKTKLQQLIQKNKGVLSIDNWIMAMQSWGIPADAISDISKTPIPGNLYLEIAIRQEKIGKAQEQILYDTIQFPETDNLYYKDHKQYQFTGKILGVLQNVVEKQKGNNIIILDRSAFYPTSGGQVNDIGFMIIKDVQYEVYNVEKAGRCVLHYLNKAVNPQEVINSQVIGKIDQQRRSILRCFHTGTHIVFAACRRVLGPHIWQHGAKKTVDYAHLDITHYSSITKQAEMEIENQANKIILQGHPIKKYFESKSQAEKEFGFRLYQGGIVPGNSIRIVNITDVDVQACCGTHADNTAQVGWIKIIKSARISDGTLRLYYVAGKKVLKALNQQTTIINQLKDMWGITQSQIVPTATRFFNENKKFDKQIKAQKLTLLSMSTKLISQSQQQMFIIPSLQKKLTLYISSMDTHLAPVILKQKTVLFINDTMLFCILSNPNHLNLQELKAILKQDEDPEVVEKKFVVKKGIEIGKGKEKVKKQNASQVIFTGKIRDKKVTQFLQASKFELLK